jgi:hypothetical protein
VTTTLLSCAHRRRGQQAAERLADLKVQQANVNAQRVGSDDTEVVVRLITVVLVLVLDPLAVLLTLAAARSAAR